MDYSGYYIRFNQTTGYFLGGIDSLAVAALEIADTTNHSNTGWHLYFMTVDRDSATGMKLYVDAIEVASRDPTSCSDTLSNTFNFYVGIFRDGSSHPFGGDIGEVFLYKRDIQIKQQRIYLATKWRYQ